MRPPLPWQRVVRKVDVVQVTLLQVAAKAAVKLEADAAKADSRVVTSATCRRKCKSAFVNAKLSLADKALALDKVLAVVATTPPLAKTMERNRSSI